MNLKNLLKNQSQASVKLSKEEEKQLLSRNCVSLIPLCVNDIISIPKGVKIHFINILGNKIPMISGIKLKSENDTISFENEAFSIGLASFGRQIYNRQTKETVSPITVAKNSNSEFDETKLLFNQIQNYSLSELPEFLYDKKYRIIGIEDVILTNSDGSTRLNSTGQPMSQSVYAFLEV